MRRVIVVAGEALVDLVAEGADRFHAVPGGSPANTAIGLARLGAPVQMLTRLSADGFGRQLTAHLRGSGVGLDLAVEASEPTPLAVATLDAEGRASYSFYVERTADRMWQPAEVPETLAQDAEAFCLGSFGLVLDPGAALLGELLERERRRGALTVLLDPNVRPDIMADPAACRARMNRLVRLADVVKISDEDLEWLAGDEDPEDAARRWVADGPQLVVVTRGSAGAFAVTAGGAELRVPAYPVDVVDTVGAGDAFMSGLVDGLRRTGLLGGDAERPLARLGVEDLRPVLTRAARVSGLTCARRGADPPRAGEVDTG